MNRLLVLVFDKIFLRNATNGLHVERVSITEDIFSENLQLWSNVLEESARYNLIFADFILIISFSVNSTYDILQEIPTGRKEAKAYFCGELGICLNKCLHNFYNYP